LKTAGLLQEWDKPKREESTRVFHTDLRLSVSELRIAVKNFPTDRLENAQNVLKYYMNHS